MHRWCEFSLNISMHLIVFDSTDAPAEGSASVGVKDPAPAEPETTEEKKKEEEEVTADGEEQSK